MRGRAYRCFLILAIVVLPAISAAAQAPTGGLRIVSPSNGGVVEPGQPFTVVVEPEPGVSPTAVALLSPSIFTFKEQPPFTYVVSVPSGAALGPEKLVADGIDARERSFRAEITLNVETTIAVTSVQVTSPALLINAEREISVFGNFVDGVRREITRSREIHYASSNPQVATVAPDGLVKAVGEGTATITVTYKDQSATVPVKVEFARQSIKIDILPGSFPNTIDLDSQGVITAAILTTQFFDPTKVDPLSVRFGPNGAIEVHGRGHLEDVNGDSFSDMVLHFSVQETGIQCLQKQATLTGSTVDGVLIRGVDLIAPRGSNCIQLPQR